MKRNFSSYQLLGMLGLSLLGIFRGTDTLGQNLPFDSRTTFDRAPWLSARAAGMAETVSPIANGLEAPYYNPAAIGGLYHKQAQPALTELYFPYFGGSADPSSSALYRQLQEGRDIGDPEVATELLRAFAGDYPYARLSVAPSVTVHRLFFSYSYDVRAASTPHGEDSDELDVDYRTQSGPMLGFSLASQRRNFYLGVSAAYLQRTETQGTFPLVTMTSIAARKEAFNAAQHKFRGSPINLGSIWHIERRWRPSFSLVIKNIFGSTFQAVDATIASYKDPQIVTLGFALSPNIGKWGMLNMVVEGDDLGSSDPNFAKKMRVGSELTLGNAFGARAGLALRIGYKHSGLSYGLGMNLGLIGINLASYTEDIGVEGSHVIERRSVVNLGINIAD